MNTDSATAMMQDEEMELQVLGGVLTGGRQAYQTATDMLQAEDFAVKAHLLIFQAMVTLGEAANGEDEVLFDVLLLRRELIDMGAFDQVGGLGMLMQLDGVVLVDSTLKRYAKALKKMAKRRGLRDGLQDILDGVDDPEQHTADLKEKLEGQLESLDKGELEDAGAPLSQILEEPDMLEYCLGDKQMTGWKTGIHELDAIMHGVKAKTLIVAGGRPAEGKSALGLNLAINISKVNDIPVAFYSLEMGITETVLRISSAMAEVSNDKVEDRNLNAIERDRVKGAYEEMKRLKLVMNAPLKMTLRQVVGQMRHDAHVYGTKVFVLDYLQMVASDTEREENRQVLVTKVCRRMKQLARELDVCIIGLAQLNREMSKREGQDGKRPQLTDLRESGELENNADVVWLLYRPDRHGIKTMNNQSTKGKAILIVDKHRNGAVGDVNLSYIEEFRKFGNLDGPGLVDAPVQMRNVRTPGCDTPVCDSPSGVKLPQGMKSEYLARERYYLLGWR